MCSEIFIFTDEVINLSLDSGDCNRNVRNVSHQVSIPQYVGGCWCGNSFNVTASQERYEIRHMMGKFFKKLAVCFLDDDLR